MNNLKLVREETKGIVTITENSQYNHVNADLVILSEKVTARLCGQVIDVVLNEGSVLNFHGTIIGKVENRGGTIRIFPN